MRDYIVRAAFHEHVLKQAHEANDTIVVDELGLRHGEIRADIAVLNGKMIGYEIKTDKDTLTRLENQVKAYNDVFAEAYVITGERHLAKVMEKVPEWWGIYLIGGHEDSVTFHRYRRARSNESRTGYSIAQLLWKQEISYILQSGFDCFIKPSYTRHKMYEMLAERCDTNEISKLVIDKLKQRQNWRISL